MNNQDMKQEFLILYDKITNFDAPGYEDTEISVFLTKGQERVALSLIRPEANQFSEGFENTEIRTKELQELVEGVTITTPSASQVGVLPNGTFFDLPANLLFSISEQITTTSTISCSNNKRIKVKPITHDEYAINVDNPFKKPSIRRGVWRLAKKGTHELITDGTFTINSYHLRYIRKLNPIIIGTNTIDGAIGPLDCELNSILHKRIIDEAVKIATGITDPEKYQIKNIEQQSGEN